MSDPGRIPLRSPRREEMDPVIPELERRLSRNPDPSLRERLAPGDRQSARLRADARAAAPASEGRRTVAEDDLADPDFALSLSSASLRLVENRAESGLLGPRVGSDPIGMPADPETTTSAPPADGSREPFRPGPASRVIAAYREIARAPVGERIRILA